MEYPRMTVTSRNQDAQSQMESVIFRIEGRKPSLFFRLLETIQVPRGI